jgi:predicted RNA-binding Zn-ribbon protein involved in translation (DUF1610 family)
MEVVERKPVPLYEAKCQECGSVLRYVAAEVDWTGAFRCPVCGVTVWAQTINPIGTLEE